MRNDRKTLERTLARLIRQAEGTPDFEAACRIEEQAKTVEDRLDNMAMDAGEDWQ